MRRVSLLVVLALTGVLVALTLAHAQQEKTRTYYLTISTRVDMPMKIPGMPDLSNIPGLGDIQLPNIPGLPGMNKDAGKPTREITGRAIYANRAVEPIWVEVPADLKLPQNRLVLEVPEHDTTEPGTPGQAEGGEGDDVEVQLTSKLYWHPETARGPITETFNSSDAEAAIPEDAADDVAEYGIAIPDWVGMETEREAYGAESSLPENLGGKGNYVLNTGGTAVITGFLGPLKVTGPQDFSAIVPQEGFTLQWEPLPDARGYIIHVDGQKSEMPEEGVMKTETTAWVSTEDEPPMRVRYDYRQATTISDDLEAGILLPADTTSCIVPPGMFPEDLNMLTIRLTAVGNDYYSEDDDITVFATIRSEWSTTVMFGGFGDFGGFEDEE